DHVAGFQGGSGNLDFAYQRSLHSFGRVVDQVCESTLDGFGVGHDVGQVSGKRSANVDSVQTPIEHAERVFHDCIEVCTLRLRRWKAGESRKFVNQRAYRFYGAADSLRAAADYFQ